ncbi:hypothetical protein [Heyndrickxia acidicola]|uniref:Uncharacterized protein n=1 Tax=Heyndrickxia acidicola TaxID=209389 RepID=A0ABU6MK25_9BACI|nr:hypothetical protein [Heyndrickxia acidicola]
MCPLIGDQHKTRRLRGSLFNLFDGLDYDLEPMAHGAGQGKAKCARLSATSIRQGG